MDGLEARMNHLERRQERVDDAIIGIKDSLQELVKLEVHHAETREGLGRAFAQLEKNETECVIRFDKLEERVRRMEEMATVTKWANKAVFMAAVAIIAAAATLVWERATSPAQAAATVPHAAP